jgi:flagellar motor switch protein FliG
MITSNLEKTISMKKLKAGINSDRKVDFRLVQQLEENIDSLRKLQNNIENNFRVFKMDFNDFLVESAGYFAKSFTEIPPIGNSGLMQRIGEALIKMKPKGKISLSVSIADYSLLRDFEPEFKSMIEPFQELSFLCNETIRPGDFRIESDNIDLKDVFESNIDKLIGILRMSDLSVCDSSIYDFDNKENISKKLEEMNFLSGFEILREIDSVVISNVINNEDPQTIAVILSRLPHEKSIEVISHLSAEKRGATCEKIKELNGISTDVIRDVEEIIYRLFKNELYQRYDYKSGVNYLTGLFGDKNNFYSKMLLNGLIKNNPELASKIAESDGGFEDIVYADDRGIQSLIKKVKRGVLAAALINSSVEVMNKFLSNMSSGAVKMLYEELELLKDITENEVFAKRKQILKVIKEMERNGELSSSKNGKENIFSIL